MLRFSRLSLRRGPKLLFRDATFQVHAGQRVGITGANGTGKSSLFQLILGELGPDSGELGRPSDWVIAHVTQETPADPRPAIEYVLDGDHELRAVEHALADAESAHDGHRVAELHAQLHAIGGYDARSRAARLLHGLGFGAGEETRPVAEFSGGWRMRLNLGRALMCRSDLLLLDEPTNHLDLEAVIWLEEWLRAYPGTLLLISHDRDVLDAVCSHIVHIEREQASIYAGNYSDFERVRAERLAGQQSAWMQQQREIAHIQRYVERFRAKASKARQAQSRLKALARMERIAPAHVDSAFHFAFQAPDAAPNPLLLLERVFAGYGHEPVLSNVTLTLSPGDRIGLLGVNGAGKSTLIKLMAGEVAPLSGRREPARDLNVGYFAQHQLEQLRPDWSPLQHLLAEHPAVPEQALRDYLGGFGFAGDQALAPGRRQHVDLVLDGEHRGIGRHQGEGRVAAGRVGDHADHAAVDELVLLGEFLAHRQFDRAAARLDARHRRADQGHRRLAGERVAHALLEVRIERLEVHHGVRSTGSASPNRSGAPPGAPTAGSPG